MDKFCCTNCFSVFEIKKFIQSNNTMGNCNYCKSKKVNVCRVDEVGQFIMEGIERYYEDAAENVGYESAEGGYLLPTSDIPDLLIEEEEVFGSVLDDPYQLLNDLVPHDKWVAYVRKDPYGPVEGDPEEITYWENFCDIVKYQQRFTTFLSLGDDNDYDYRKPVNFLFYLAERFIPSRITILQPTTKIFRGRIESGNKPFGHLELTSPPSESSKNNRMGPAGISFFYGAMEPETAIHEVRPEINENVIVGEFEVVENLFILDLTEEVESPKSIFDPGYVFYYEEFFKPFLVHFGKEISKHVRRTDNEIEYVPTQVLTEFLKNMNFKNHYLHIDENNQEEDVFLSGILFKSSVKNDGNNIVLFRGNNISTERQENKGRNHWLLFRGKKTYQVSEIRISSTLFEFPDLARLVPGP